LLLSQQAGAPSRRFFGFGAAAATFSTAAVFGTAWRISFATS
jgi:hypothetical protein